MASNGETLVLALGGNAIVGRSRKFQSQLEAISLVTGQIARMARRGYRIVITHGNGPQVGDTLLRHESAKHLVPPLPLYACVAETQGLLGFMIQSSLSHHLRNNDVACLVSISYVSRNDPAFKKPSKPIGQVYDKDAVQEVRKLHPNAMFKETSSNRYRRLVASPNPISVGGSRVVKALLKNGNVVITAGGGGIPAVRDGSKTIFVDAVVDKDLASERLATSIGASKLVILTDVEGVYLDYAGSRKLLRNVTVREMKAYLEDGEFEEGSMAPKVRASVRFVENTGNSAIICNLARMDKALTGKTGTIVHM